MSNIFDQFDTAKVTQGQPQTKNIFDQFDAKQPGQSQPQATQGQPQATQGQPQSKNIFDQFDAPAQAQQSQQKSGNVFDKFDAPARDSQAGQDHQQQKSLSDMNPLEAFRYGGGQSIASLIGTGETAAQMVTGALASSAAGFKSIYDALAGEDADKVKDDIASIERDYTYHPRTETGQRYAQNVANTINLVMDPIQKGFNYAADKTLKTTGSPVLATLVQSAPDIAGTIAPAFGGIKGAVQGDMAARAAMRADREAVRDLAKNNEDSRLAMDEPDTTPAKEASSDDIKQQIERKRLFNQEGIPATKGDITQNFEQQAQESRLQESTSDPSADKFRGYILKRSNALKNNLENLAEKSGISDEAGSAIKEALTKRQKMLRTKKNDLYNEALSSARSGGIKDIPILTDDIRAAIPDKETMGDLAVTSEGPVKKLGKLLERYGVIGEDAETPLSVGNMERFRQSLNAIDKTDDSGAVKVATGSIRNALDEEMDNVGGTLDNLGITDKNIVEPLTEARKTNRQMKTEFNPKGIAGKLTANKKFSDNPVIENSQAYNKLMSKSTPVEHVQQVSAILSKSQEGKKALGNMQAAVIMDALDAAMEAKTRKIKGQSTFSSVAFEKRLDQMGDKKLAAIFKGNTKALAQLKRVKKISENITPPSGAVQKGSANIILDLLGKTGIKAISAKVPGLDVAMEGFERLAESAKSRAELDKAMDSSPEVKNLAEYISETHPALSAALGIPAGGSLAVSRQEEN
jgi:hypothetical protein